LLGLQPKQELASWDPRQLGGGILESPGIFLCWVWNFEKPNPLEVVGEKTTCLCYVEEKVGTAISSWPWKGHS
jgi:hypothetical protein